MRTQTHFKSKEDFESFWAKSGGKTQDRSKLIGEEKVVAEGVTDREALAMIRKTPIRSYISAAMEEATGPDGVVDQDVLDMQIQNMAIGLGALWR